MGMNYFNYYSEIEDEFIKRRGSHLWVSSLDWSLIDTWKQRGIPLHIVLRGINDSFDGYNSKLNRNKKINSLFYCQQEVESIYQIYRESRVGSNEHISEVTSDNNQSIFDKSSVINQLNERTTDIKFLSIDDSQNRDIKDLFIRAASRLEEIIADLNSGNTFSPESLETDLMLIEQTLIDDLKGSISPDEMDELTDEGNRLLKPYKKSMEKEVFKQTLDNFIAGKIRERYKIPRLSLFYM